MKRRNVDSISLVARSSDFMISCQPFTYVRHIKVPNISLSINRYHYICNQSYFVQSDRINRRYPCSFHVYAICQNLQLFVQVIYIKLEEMLHKYDEVKVKMFIQFIQHNWQSNATYGGFASYKNGSVSQVVQVLTLNVRIRGLDRSSINSKQGY